MKKKESIFQLLTQKPWETDQIKVDNMHEGATIDLSKGKLGLRFIMFVSTIFFCLFIVTYSDRMVYPDWQKMPEPFLLWINTIVLFFYITACHPLAGWTCLLGYCTEESLESE